MRIVTGAVALVVGAAFAAATPAFAQFGKLGDIGRRGAAQAQKVADLNISESEERELGERVSAAVRKEFGVMQDAALTKYVSLVGTVLARASSRPDLKWEFIVLDTDGVNAFAAPGGLVHITRGALGLIRSEAELAGVISHEIAHITKKHTVNAIKKSKTIKMGTEEASRGSRFVGMLADEAYDNIVEKGFDRGDENDADQEGVRLANKAGYNPSGLGVFLQKLIDRNKGRDDRNGLFASHPETADRIQKLGRQIKSERLGASPLVEPRYAASVKVVAKPVTEIVTTGTNARGVTGGGPSKAPKQETKEPPKEQEKKGGGMFGGLKGRLTGSSQQESTQASASAGGRAVDRPDRFARGGDNPNKVAVALSAAEIETFRKGIA